MSADDRHFDLTMEAVTAELPWRPELRGAGVENLRYVFEVIGMRTRSALRGINGPDAGALDRRLRALVRECDALLAEFDFDAMGSSIEAAVASAGSLDEDQELVAAFLRLVGAQSDDLAAIASLAKRLRERSARFSERYAIRRDHRVDYERRAFIAYAAELWETLTGQSPGVSRTGPFVRFCACAWIECEMSDLGEDTAAALGPSIETYLKIPAEKGGVAR